MMGLIWISYYIQSKSVKPSTWPISSKLLIEVLQEAKLRPNFLSFFQLVTKVAYKSAPANEVSRNPSVTALVPSVSESSTELSIHKLPLQYLVSMIVEDFKKLVIL